MSLDRYVISVKASLYETLIHMDKNKIKFIFVESDGHIIGTVTDGDIRRGLLDGNNLSDEIKLFMNSNFTYLYDNDSINCAVEIFQQKELEFIPILNKNKVLCNIITRHTLNVLLLINKNMDFHYDYLELNKIKVEHEIYIRPWGYYKTMVLAPSFQTKIIYIKPKQSLSLQSHKHRREYWTIIFGEGIIQLDEDCMSAVPGNMYYIPKGSKHRMTNSSDNQILILSEVQLGDYFGEDDIIRYEDYYGRV